MHTHPPISLTLGQGQGQICSILIMISSIRQYLLLDRLSYRPETLKYCWNICADVHGPIRIFLPLPQGPGSRSKCWTLHA